MNLANSPAFPNRLPTGEWPLDEIPELIARYQGMTKRELFAAMAMQGMLANESLHGDQTALAVGAVNCADALLAELSKEPRS